jgi:hypothetical protein
VWRRSADITWPAGILRPRAILIVAACALLASDCRAPTEITLVVTTDVACNDLQSTSVTVGHTGEIETKAPTTSSTFCSASGALGALVVVPSGGKGDELALKVVAALAS